MALYDPLQLIVIGVIVVVVLLWGPKKIPELARSIGITRREFTQASKESAKPTAGQLTAANAPDQTLIDTARKLGIDTEGKTREQISDEIVNRVKTFS
ncbi:MAG: twin-arginine translocase TatA/TatE family subunit [Thaumarchaeota archaeon]|nr:MAG: twin-arginine translocase TatA/TatE family subunit [Nitrososphaerota archaeon]